MYRGRAVEDNTVLSHVVVSQEAGEIESMNRGVSGVLSHTNYWSRKRILQACILVMAVIGAVVGTQHIITRMSIDNSHLQLLQGDVQITSRATMEYRRPQLFRVGGPDALWVAPSSPDFFTSWASGISFRVGDVLRIVGGEYGTYLYDVPAASYDSCNNTDAVTWYYLNKSGKDDLFIQLTEIRTYNLKQGEDPAACVSGLKFAATVNVLDTPLAPPRPNVNAPARAPRVFQVGGDTATWTVPSATNFYEDWASTVSFVVGDVLSFTLSDSTFGVDEVPYTSFEKCSNVSSSWNSKSSTKLQLATSGIKYFVANTPQYCVQGMKFTANVYDNGGPTASPTPPSKSSSGLSVGKIIGIIVGCLAGVLGAGLGSYAFCTRCNCLKITVKHFYNPAKGEQNADAGQIPLKPQSSADPKPQSSAGG